MRERYYTSALGAQQVVVGPEPSVWADVLGSAIYELDIVGEVQISVFFYLTSLIQQASKIIMN